MRLLDTIELCFISFQNENMISRRVQTISHIIKIYSELLTMQPVKLFVTRVRSNRSWSFQLAAGKMYCAKCKLLHKMHICHFPIFFLQYPVFSRAPFFREFRVRMRARFRKLCGGECRRLVDHRCRSVQSIHLCKATLVDGGTVTNSCLSPIGIRIVNSRDKVNSHVFGAN